MKTNVSKMVWTLCFLCGATAMAFSQRMEIKGRVTDGNDGTPLVGVSVQIKGSSVGTVSNLDGDYLLVAEKGNTLVFSYIGYVAQEVKVEQQRLDVALIPDTQMLEETIIVGYGVDRKLSGRLTGATRVRKDKVRPQLAYAVAPIASFDTYQSEEYAGHAENRFLTAKDQPLSTFSLDVDAASYSNVRRMINQGKMPEKDAVRIEEMVNYFNYAYEQPRGEHPVNILTELAECPWNDKHYVLRIGVKAKEIPSESLPPANLVFLIDVSGSMQGATRLDLVKSSMKLLVNNLRDEDRVAIVTYANNVQEVLQPTSAGDRQKIMDAVDALQASGGTAGGDGIQRAYRMAEKNFVKGGNNRIVLCTDGDFNIGISDPKDLEQLIESKRKTGVYLTVLGYGMGNYKDNRLQTLAEKGNGNHAYIDNIQEANKVLVNEFGSTMYTVAKDVKIQVEFNPALVGAYRLIGYESRLLNKEDFNDDTKDAGELGAGHTVTALYEIIPVGVENPYGGVDELKYQKAEKKKAKQDRELFADELLTVKLRYKEPESTSSKRMEIPVLMSSLAEKPSADFKFAMSVAMFGQLLKDSDFKGNADYEQVAVLAKEGIGEDEYGYRKEFIRLVESVRQLSK